MKIQLKRTIYKFNLEYGIAEPALKDIADFAGCHPTNISRIFKDPSANITGATLEGILGFLYFYYKPKFTSEDPKKFFKALIAELVEFEVALELAMK